MMLFAHIMALLTFFIVAILVGVTQYLVMVLICFLLKPSLDGRVSVHVPLPSFVFSLLHLGQQFSRCNGKGLRDSEAQEGFRSVYWSLASAVTTTIITLVTGGMCECLFRVLAFAILWITQVLQKINQFEPHL